MEVQSQVALRLPTRLGELRLRTDCTEGRPHAAAETDRWLQVEGDTRKNIIEADLVD